MSVGDCRECDWNDDFTLFTTIILWHWSCALMILLFLLLVSPTTPPFACTSKTVPPRTKVHGARLPRVHSLHRTWSSPSAHPLSSSCYANKRCRSAPSPEVFALPCDQGCLFHTGCSAVIRTVRQWQKWHICQICHTYCVVPPLWLWSIWVSIQITVKILITGPN